MTSSHTSASTTKQDRASVLYPRNIRIQDTIDELLLERLNGHRKAAEERIEKFGARERLEDDGIWLCEESPEIKTDIDNKLEKLVNKKALTVEAEWSALFWQLFFFKPEKDVRSILGRFLEERQLRSESYADIDDFTSQIDETDIQDRYPPIVSHFSRPSVLCAPEPWILSKFKKRGYAYLDVLFANMTECEPEDFLDDIQRYPTIRLFRNSEHLSGVFFAEIKPLGLPKDRNELKDHAVRYSTLTAAIMLHEKLKLCHMASDDPAFFPKSDDLGIHFIAAVGYTAYHYYHCFRGNVNKFVKYVSYPVHEFDLRYADHRNSFRQQLNLIHVYHSTIVREIELARLRKVHRLGKEEVESRLLSRAHKHILFEYVKRGDLDGFRAGDQRKAVEGIAPTLETRNPVNPTGDTSVEEQLNEAGITLPLRAADTGKPFTEDLEGTPKDGDNLLLARPTHDQDAVINGGMITKSQKHTCGSTNTTTGERCKNPLVFSESDGFFRCRYYPKHKSAM